MVFYLQMAAQPQMVEPLNPYIDINVLVYERWFDVWYMF